MKVFDLSAVLGEEVPYIVALQTALPDGKADLAELARHTKILDQNMHKVKVALASIFFVATSMTRDDAGVELNDGYKETYLPEGFKKNTKGTPLWKEIRGLCFY